MASIGTDPNGFRRILFFAGNGKRKTIRLGRVSMKHATSAKLHVEELIAAQSLRRSVAQDTGKWLGEIDDKLYARIASVGLVRARDRSGGFAQVISRRVPGRVEYQRQHDHQLQPHETLPVGILR